MINRGMGNRMLKEGVCVLFPSVIRGLYIIEGNRSRLFFSRVLPHLHAV